jgi:hypothetical protein
MVKKGSNNKLLKFAQAISYIFDGSVLALPIFIAVIFFNNKNRSISDVLLNFLITSFFIAFIPYLFIFFLYKSKRISDLQMPKRKERYIPLMIINLSVITGFCVLLFSSPAKLLLTVYSIYLLCLPVISIITFFWKISFHSSYITLFSIIYLIVFGKWAVFTLVLIPLVGWSRIKLKKHTLAQVLVGVVVTAITSLSILHFTGYLSTGYWAVNEILELFKNTSIYINLILPSFSVSVLFLFLYMFVHMFIKNKEYDDLFD